jgi:glycosyltransferase involved in cell wall biosynthesis
MDSARSTAFSTTAGETPTAEMPVLIPKQSALPTVIPAVMPAIPAPRVPNRHPLAGRHALIVGINYAPEPTGIAPYTTGMADYLAQHAGGVTVLTGVPHYPNWQLDHAYRWALRTTEASSRPNPAGMRILRMRHYVPGRQNALTRAGYEATFLLNALSSRLSQRPDVVIAVTPSLGGAVAGARLARRHGSKLIVVVQDLMAKAASQSGILGGSFVARTTGAIERYALTRADLVAMVSETFRAQLHEFGVPDEKIRMLPNWTHISPARLSRVQARRALGWPTEPFTVVHTGNIGLKQDLGNLVEAAWQCRADSGVRFVIVGDGSQRAYIEAQGAGLANLSFVDPLDAEQYPKSLAAADVLVVNERPGVGDMSLPSKLTSYLCAGRPVIAAVAADGATAQELERTGGAAIIVPPGDATTLVEAVLNLRRDELRSAQMAAAGQRYAETTLGQDAASARLDALIEECLSQP